MSVELLDSNVLACQFSSADARKRARFPVRPSRRATAPALAAPSEVWFPDEPCSDDRPRDSKFVAGPLERGRDPYPVCPVAGSVTSRIVCDTGAALAA